MEKTQNPGIGLKSVNLVQCNIGQLKYDVELKFELGIKEFGRKVSDDGKVLQILVEFDLMNKVENPPCRFDCAFIAIYTRPDNAPMKWEEFKDHIAVAHMVPFVREFISNMTNRMPLQVLMIPPMNTSKMLAEFRGSRTQVEPAPVSN